MSLHYISFGLLLHFSIIHAQLNSETVNIVGGGSFVSITKKVAIPEIRYVVSGEIFTDASVFTLPMKGRVEQSAMYNTVQYRIRCDAQADLKTVPLISDDEVERRVAFGKCADLLSQNYVVFTTRENLKTVATLNPVPVYQTWRDIEINQDDPGIPRHAISSCCSQLDCPNRCINATPGKNCYLQLYAVGARSTVSGGGGLSTITMSYFNLLMRIRCQLCITASCVTECNNGQVVEIMPVHVFMRLTPSFACQQYASEYSYYEYGIQLNNLNCTVCSPGTWNTCLLNALSCPW